MANQVKVLSKDQVSEIEKVTKGHITKSQKIRALAAAGWSRADIARGLDIRYQHVRNVLIQPVKRVPVTSNTTSAPTPAQTASK